MTFEDVRQAALARLLQFTTRYPQGKAVPYRRIGIRQQDLYDQAADVNPEFGGDGALAELDAGAADLNDIAAPVGLPARITRIEVSDPGDSPYAIGKEISVVGVDDPEAAAAPRATLRQGVLRGWAAELDDVTEILVYYPFQPAPADPAETGVRVVEIPSPHDELLVIDLTKALLRSVGTLTPAVRADILGDLTDEETPRLAGWLKHAHSFAPLQSRFARPPSAPKGGAGG